MSWLSKLQQGLRRFRQSYFWHDHFAVWIFFSSLFSNLIIWITIYLTQRRVIEFIPLHYNVYFGVDIIGYWQELFKIPGIALFFLVINYILAYILFKKEKLVAYFLVATTILIQILSLIIIIFIINL
ncbi:MAG: hypothetical protein PHS07_00745 [Patescibacteria group bacterium]|jgi:hypothetical protein|nr:hypothetical protein [Patescibacteria group bacterium]